MSPTLEERDSMWCMFFCQIKMSAHAFPLLPLAKVKVIKEVCAEKWFHRCCLLFLNCCFVCYYLFLLCKCKHLCGNDKHYLQKNAFLIEKNYKKGVWLHSKRALFSAIRCISSLCRCRCLEAVMRGWRPVRWCWSVLSRPRCFLLSCCHLSPVCWKGLVLRVR